MTRLHVVEDDLGDGAMESWLAPDIARLESLLKSHAMFEEYLLTHGTHDEQA